ncbi:23S rRNA (uracil(1939)-C(5))-methyltransferase RlmD [Erysipelothrix urinaevulpis]|uniref:23S rRNA (uracil(1939)-C(5))-methyltransferase RlmD n=1 Tax=Erysipelothrix urinaevulpis TaxID=2683717 RepID=UPI001357FA6A|nr:23S rRNA (uracil(1939)-C(5))-methyltransferase RlmD [Erysipelothrix urinaevulpis]
MLQKNEQIELEIIDLSDQGFGVAKVDGFTVFVESALPNERVIAKIINVQKRFAIAILVEVLKQSDDRIDILDKKATITGTMPLQHMTYQAQLKFKEKTVKDLITTNIVDDKIEFLPIIGMKNPWNYRNKGQIPVREVNGVLETGFFRRRSHQLIPIEEFYIQDKRIDKTVLLVRDLLRKYNISAYDETFHEGIIRNIVVRQAQHTDEQMIILVTNTTDRLNQDFINELIDTIPNLVSLVQNINTKQTNVILGTKKRVLFGDDTYQDKILDLTFKISSQSFFQVNSDQTEVLYQTALEFAELKEEDVVVDAYSGIGTISLMMAKQARHVYGVEIVEDAVKMAKENARLNKINNVSFVADKAENFMKEYIKTQAMDVLMVDPPRKGLHPSFIEAVLETEPERIVYVSCNPKSLANDLKQLSEKYDVVKVQAVDMFPHTLHVETVVLLQQKAH